jgi:hypothetical protein
VNRSPMIVLAAILAVSGCGGPKPPGSTIGDVDVVATFDDGRITDSDIDRALLSLPAGALRVEAATDVNRLEQVVRQLAFQRLLVAEAPRRGLDRDPEFQRLEVELRREVTVGLFLETHPLAPAPPTEAEIRAWYDEKLELRRRAARRIVYHIFKRYRPGVPRAEVEAEVAELRRRVVAGEPFPALAAAHSDSELRHTEGFLGVVERGQLPPELDAVVFSLDENVPSEPIATRDGVHLFLVTTAVEDKQFGFDEVRVQANEAVMAAKFEAAVEELVEAWRVGGEASVVDQEQLRKLLSEGDPAALVMRLGDRELTVGDFQILLARATRTGVLRTADAPAILLKNLERRELIYQRLVRDGMVDEAEVERRMDRRLRDELAVWYVERRLGEFVDEQSGRLREHYESNVMRFAGPLRLDLRRLVVPLGDQPAAVMARLEGAREALDAGDLDLEALAAELRGRTEELGWINLAELQRLEPKAVLFTDQVQPGRYSAPFLSPAGLQVLQVIDRQEPAPLPYATVREQVRDDFLRSHHQELVAELGDQMLGNARLKVFTDRLQNLIDTGFGAIAE